DCVEAEKSTDVHRSSPCVDLPLWGCRISAEKVRTPTRGQGHPNEKAPTKSLGSQYPRPVFVTRPQRTGSFIRCALVDERAATTSGVALSEVVADDAPFRLEGAALHCDNRHELRADSGARNSACGYG